MKILIKAKSFEDQQLLTEALKKATDYNVISVSDSSGKRDYLYSIELTIKE